MLNRSVRRASSRQGRSVRFRPRLEALEDRLTPATITVTTISDDVTPNDGSVSLREAITAVNAGNDLGDPDLTAQTPGTFGSNDRINFNVPGATLHTISVGSSASASGQALPPLTKPVFIDGYSQPGSSPNMLAVGDNAVLLVELNGSATSSGSGLSLVGGSTVQGLIVNRFKNEGILSSVEGGDTISGNFLGTDATGLLNRGNGSAGALLLGPNNTVGGTTPAARNVVAFNAGSGVEVASSAGPGDVILGNDVFSNAGLGIDLNGNGQLGVPTITSAVGTTVRGTFNSTPGTTFRIELFSSDSADPSGFGEGQQFIGFINVTTDASGTASFKSVLAASLTTGHVVTATATAAGGNTSGFSATAPASSLTPLYVVDTNAGGAGEALAFEANGGLQFDLTPFFGFAGSVSVATADVNGDGFDDLIAGAGPGAPNGHVKVLDGNTGQPLASFFAFPGWAAGVVVAAGDVNDDGFADLIVGASGSANGHVKVFDGRTGQLLQSFLAFPGYGGALAVAAGDVNGDARADVVVAAASAGANGHVKAFSGVDGGLLVSFISVPGSGRAISIAMGDVDGDGKADFIVGQGGAGSGRVTVFNANVLALFAFAVFPGSAGDVTVTAKDLNNDGKAEIIPSAEGIEIIGTQRFSEGPHVEVFDGATLGVLDSFFAFSRVPVYYSSDC